MGTDQEIVIFFFLFRANASPVNAELYIGFLAVRCVKEFGRLSLIGFLFVGDF